MTEQQGKKTTFIHNDLFERCRKGDEEAQREVYRLYYRAMYNISLRILGSTAEAEDAMQDAFLKAFRNISSCKENASFGGWLKRIVVNQSIDALRERMKLRFEEESKIPGAEWIDEKGFAEDHEMLVELAERIKKSIGELPEGYRVILSLHLLEGYDHEEIGQILKIKPSTSRSQYARGRQKLLELLNEHGIKKL